MCKVCGKPLLHDRNSVVVHARWKHKLLPAQYDAVDMAPVRIRKTRYGVELKRLFRKVAILELAKKVKNI